MGVASKRPPHHVLGEQPLPQGLLLHDARVAEVGDAAVKLSGEAAVVLRAEAAEAATVTQLPVQHVDVTVGVYEAYIAAAPHRAGSQGQPPPGSSAVLMRGRRTVDVGASVRPPAYGG